MRMQIKNTSRDLAGGLYPQLVLKPVIDLLATVRYNFISKYDLLFKAGAAYRQMQLTDRTSSKDSLRSVNGELQAGLGYQLTKHTRLVGLYQCIYAHARVKYSLTSTGNYIQLGHIPLQQAGFFGVEYAF
jgi:predicted porin